MTLKDSVLSALYARYSAPVSGEELAARLGVTRAAVWKAIKSLLADGHEISAAPNKGYVLTGSRALSAQGVEHFLKSKGYDIEYSPEIDSTNAYIKRRAEEGAPAGLVMMAASQTAGRGRLGRKFYSPPGSGIYMSVLLRPQIAAPSALYITTAAAVATARAIDALGGGPAKIKWVNDILVNGKKTTGILTEAALSMETGEIEWAALGIGVNVTQPENGFPDEINAVAGPAFDAPAPELQNKLAAKILDELASLSQNPRSGDTIAEYRERLATAGQRVIVLPENREASCLGIDDEYALIVKYDDGEIRHLASGEVSARPV